MIRRNGMARKRWADRLAAGTGRTATVLVVEDDEDARFAMAAVLVAEGYQALTAGTARDALATLRAPLSPVDVAVLDVHLPDVSGTDLCRRLLALHPGLPVIVCTGEATPEEVTELVRLGARRYLRKPVSADELLATVEAALP
jgi:DNA-binding response OmpR family regulator